MTNVPSKVLFVEDEAAVREPVARFLRGRGFVVEEVSRYSQAIEVMSSFRPDVALLDYELPDGNGLLCMEAIRRLSPALPVVVLTGYGTVDLAVRAVKGGAQHFFQKPVELAVLAGALEGCVEDSRRTRHSSLKMRAVRAVAHPFVGTSRAIRELEDMARRVASSNAPVLVLGETGTGKSVLARWLHENGPRKGQTWVDLNCAGLSRELVENELFGHERGAYTGAHASKPGLFETAHGGTLFLDEIGDIDIAVQPKLLKVIEEQVFRRIGDVRDRDVDVRLIAATRHDLAALVRSGTFRDDLYFRINTLTLAMPALRDRREDIPALARLQLDDLSARLARGTVEIATDAERAMLAHAWPGNLRQLRNVLERALLLSEDRVLRASNLRFEGTDTGTPERRTNLTLEELEREHIVAVLTEEGGHVERAARRLGVPRSSLYQKLKRFGISPSRI